MGKVGWMLLLFLRLISIAGGYRSGSNIPDSNNEVKAPRGDQGGMGGMKLDRVHESRMMQCLRRRNERVLNLILKIT